MCLEPANKLRFRFEGYRIDDESSTTRQGGKSLVTRRARNASSRLGGVQSKIAARAEMLIQFCC